MRTFRLMLLALSLGIAADVYAAGKRPGEFQTPNQMSEEELAEAKARSKNKINGFDEKMEEKPKEFPVMFVGLVGLVFLVATPFALRAYRNTSKEIAGQAKALRAGDDEA